MSCDQYAETLSDLIDGTIEESARVSLDAHLAACAGCRALVADLRQIRQAATTLDRVSPPDRVWANIAATIRADQAIGASEALKSRTSGLPFTRWGWLAAAALVALVAGTAVLILPDVGLRDQAGDPQVAGSAHEAADQAALIESVEGELRLAEEHYDRAITGLEQIAEFDDETLDPHVAATLQKNLGVIDQAIAESRAALRAEPRNQVAQETLFDVMWRKVSLLQDTISLVNEMRKGNQSEAARIVEGLNRP